MKNKFYLVFLTLVIVLVFAAGCSSPAKNESNNEDTSSVKTVTFNVVAKRFEFTPSTITVSKGDKVVINISSLDATHGFALSDFGINEEIRQGEMKQITFVADKTGTFEFYCSVYCGTGHPDMKGKLTVVDNGTVPPAKNSALDLNGQGLSKIPNEVFSMTDLEILDISNNNLTGTLPGEIRFLKNLKKLKAGSNNMTGIPAEIGQLSNLEELDYSNNQITGLPLEIGNLKNLKIFNLTGNDFSEYDMDLIEKELPNLDVIF